MSPKGDSIFNYLTNLTAFDFIKAVLFFTGTDRQDVQYDVETQICTVRFLLIMIWKMWWYQHYIGQPERLALLQLLDFYMSGCEYYKKLHTLCDFVFPEKMETKFLKEFMCIVQYGPHDTETSKLQYIVSASMNSQLVPQVSVYDSKAYDDFEYAVQCQPDDGHLLSPGGTCRKVLKRVLHRLVDHRCIFEVQEHGKVVEYGSEAGDYFSITMTHGQENVFFDGTNAIEFRVTDERLDGWRVHIGSVKMPIRLSCDCDS